jgi:hypothetical protein
VCACICMVDALHCGVSRSATVLGAGQQTPLRFTGEHRACTLVHACVHDTWLADPLKVHSCAGSCWLSQLLLGACMHCMGDSCVCFLSKCGVHADGISAPVKYRGLVLK